jgi:hypothetical protein
MIGSVLSPGIDESSSRSVAGNVLGWIRFGSPASRLPTVNLHTSFQRRLIRVNLR